MHTPAVIVGGRSKARPPSPADATPALPGSASGNRCRERPKPPKPPRNPRRGQRLSWNPKRSLTARRFFSWTVHGPFSFLGRQKENGGCIPAGKAGVVPALRRREKSRAFEARSPRAGSGAKNEDPSWGPRRAYSASYTQACLRSLPSRSKRRVPSTRANRVSSVPMPTFRPGWMLVPR